MASYTKLKGTYDIPPKETDFFRLIEESVQKTVDRYGYKKVAFPVIEYVNLFSRGVGESSDIVVKKEMYVFEDRGHRMIALRPEGTASAVRMYLENNLGMQGYTAKLFYAGPMFRAENPQAGRYRQFTQFGIEMIGDGNPFADVELIQLNRDIFKSLGIEDYTIYINSIGCKGCRPVYLESLKTYFKDKLDGMCEDCRTRYNVNVMRILDCKEEACRKVIEKAPAQTDCLCPVCTDHFTKVKSGLEALKIPYEVDTRLVRGLDYYNRTVFEIKSSLLGAQSTISAGGRYDYLVKELGGMETPAAGFAIGMERLAMVLEASVKKPRNEYYKGPSVYLAVIGEENALKALEIMDYFRSQGIDTVTEYRYSALKKHLKSADSMQAKTALFLGADEIASGKYTLRILSDGSQVSGTLEELAGYLKR